MSNTKKAYIAGGCFWGMQDLFRTRPEILDYFYRMHNPTTIDQQGNDMGSSYRSAIFYQNEEEKAEAEEMIAIVNASGKWSSKVITTLEPFVSFWTGEDYHQDYLVKNPNGYTCHFLRFEESFIKG